MTRKEAISDEIGVDPLDVYFKDIKRYPLLTRDEERALFLERKQGEEAQANLARGDGHLTDAVKTNLQQQIEAGQRAASELYDAAVEKALGTPPFDWSDYKFREIVEAYLAGEIDSVTGIYLAMEVAKERTPPKN